MNRAYDFKHYTSTGHKVKRFIVLLVIMLLMMGTIVVYTDNVYVLNVSGGHESGGETLGVGVQASYSNSDIANFLVALDYPITPGFHYNVTIDNMNWLNNTALGYSQSVVAHSPTDVTPITTPHIQGYYVVGLNTIGVPGISTALRDGDTYYHHNLIIDADLAPPDFTMAFSYTPVTVQMVSAEDRYGDFVPFISPLDLCVGIEGHYTIDSHTRRVNFKNSTFMDPARANPRLWNPITLTLDPLGDFVFAGAGGAIDSFNPHQIITDHLLRDDTFYIYIAPRDEYLLAADAPFTGTVFIDGTGTNALREFEVMFHAVLTPPQDINVVVDAEPTLGEAMDVIRVPTGVSVTYRNTATGQDSTMIPLRPIAEALGADVNWSETTRTVTITRDDMNLSLQVDTQLPDDMGVPLIIDGRTFVPIAYVAQLLEAEVSWDDANQVMHIYA